MGTTFLSESSKNVLYLCLHNWVKKPKATNYILQNKELHAMNPTGHVKVKLKISVMNDLCEDGKDPDC